jgi:hypothetical protein
LLIGFSEVQGDLFQESWSFLGVPC